MLKPSTTLLDFSLAITKRNVLKRGFLTGKKLIGEPNRAEEREALRKQEDTLKLQNDPKLWQSVRKLQD